MTVGGAQVRKMALSLPETSETPHFDWASFMVRGKRFANLSADGKLLNLFLADTDLECALVMYPECVEKLLWSAKAHGVQVTLPWASRTAISELLDLAWSRKAPDNLTAASSRTR
jgi:hypothetical protein